MLLKIKPTNKTFSKFYKSDGKYYNDDSGYDLYVLEDVEILPGETKFIDLGIQCEMLDKDKNVSYYLYPRSSISKTPLVLANSVGIIDAGYRGNLKAAVKYIPTFQDLLKLTFSKKAESLRYKIKAGTRLFQICANNLEPFHVEFCENLSKTKRGSNGFGSTGI